MRKNYSFFILLLLIIIAFFLRVYRISTNPPSLYSDEVDAAYQASVFNQCGTDYYGNKFPTHFHSYSDWRTPLLIYSISFSQKIFGINEFSTRFPSLFFGVLSILVFYLLINIVFKNKNMALFGVFLMAFSPWHIHYSRIGFEVTGMLFSYLLGLYFLFKFKKTLKISHFLLFLFWQIISIYFYSTAKLFVFITFFITAVFYSKDILRLKFKKIILSMLFCFILLSPFLIDTVNNKAGYRFSYINIFSDPTVSKEIDRERQVDSITDQGAKIGLKPTIKSKIFHNKISSWASKFGQNYISSFSSDFLFLEGDKNLRHGLGGVGYFLAIDFFLIFAGLFSIGFFVKKNSDIQKQILYFAVLLILSPFPFALTRDSIGPHGTRLFLMLPFILILISLGFMFLIDLFKKSKHLKSCFLIVFFASYLFLFLNFYHYYFYHYPQISAPEWDVGIKEAVLDSYQEQYSQYFYSNKYESFLPFFLLWTQIKPSNNNCDIAENIPWVRNISGFTGMSINNKYYFGHLEWNPILKDIKNYSKAIFIIPGSEFISLMDEINHFPVNKDKININQIKTIQTPYINGEKFIFFNLSLK